MYDRTLFLSLQITKADIRPQVKWAVNLAIADSHFNLPQGFVWVNILTLSPHRAVGKDANCHTNSGTREPC